MTNPKRAILVIGAGELGLPVITHLSTRPLSSTVSISVLIRPSTLASTDPTKITLLSHLRSLNTTLIPADIVTSPLSSLTQTFTPFHTIICCSGYSSGANGTQLKITKAVLAARTPLYFPWQFGGDYDELGRGTAQELFDEQLDVRKLLRGQGVTRWVIVSCGVFMSFLFEGFWGVLELERGQVGTGTGEGRAAVCRGLGAWERKVTATTPDDIGRCVAELVFHSVDVGTGEGRRSGECGTLVRLCGSTITYGEIANMVEEILGTMKVTREEWTVEELKKQSMQDPGDGVKKYRVVFGEETGFAWDERETYNFKPGMEMVDVRSWLEKLLGREESCP